MDEINYSYEELVNILQEVRLCKTSGVTVKEKFECPSAELFLTWINGFSKYCIPEKAEVWKRTIRNILYKPSFPKPEDSNVLSDQELINIENNAIIEYLYPFMDAGRVMQVYHNTNSWEAVDELIKKQGLPKTDFGGLTNKMIQFSPIGFHFVDRYIFGSKKWLLSFNRLLKKLKKENGTNNSRNLSK